MSCEVGQVGRSGHGNQEVGHARESGRIRGVDGSWVGREELQSCGRITLCSHMDSVLLIIIVSLPSPLPSVVGHSGPGHPATRVHHLPGAEAAGGAAKAAGGGGRQGRMKEGGSRRPHLHTFRGPSPPCQSAHPRHTHVSPSRCTPGPRHDCTAHLLLYNRPSFLHCFPCRINIVFLPLGLDTTGKPRAPNRTYLCRSMSPMSSMVEPGVGKCGLTNCVWPRPHLCRSTSPPPSMPSVNYNRRTPC